MHCDLVLADLGLFDVVDGEPGVPAVVGYLGGSLEGIGASVAVLVELGDMEPGWRGDGCALGLFEFPEFWVNLMVTMLKVVNSDEDRSVREESVLARYWQAIELLCSCFQVISPPNSPTNQESVACNISEVFILILHLFGIVELVGS